MSADTAMKTALTVALRETGTTRIALAARLGIDAKAVRRMLDPHHRSSANRDLIDDGEYVEPLSPYDAVRAAGAFCAGTTVRKPLVLVNPRSVRAPATSVNGN